MRQLQALACLNSTIAGPVFHDAVAAGGGEAAAAAVALANISCPASPDTAWGQSWLTYQQAVRVVYMANLLNTTDAMYRCALYSCNAV